MMFDDLIVFANKEAMRRRERRLRQERDFIKHNSAFRVYFGLDPVQPKGPPSIQLPLITKQRPAKRHIKARRVNGRLVPAQPEANE